MGTTTFQWQPGDWCTVKTYFLSEVRQGLCVQLLPALGEGGGGFVHHDRKVLRLSTWKLLLCAQPVLAVYACTIINLINFNALSILKLGLTILICEGFKIEPSEFYLPKEACLEVESLSQSLCSVLWEHTPHSVWWGLQRSSGTPLYACTSYLSYMLKSPCSNWMTLQVTCVIVSTGADHIVIECF